MARNVTAFGRLTIPYVVDTRQHVFRAFVREYNPTTGAFTTPSGTAQTLQATYDVAYRGILEMYNGGQTVALNVGNYETRQTDGSYVLTNTVSYAGAAVTRRGSNNFINPSNQVTFTVRCASNKTARFVLFGVPFEQQFKLERPLTSADPAYQFWQFFLPGLVPVPTTPVVDRANTPTLRVLSVSYDTNDKLRRLYNQV